MFAASTLSQPKSDGVSWSDQKSGKRTIGRWYRRYFGIALLLTGGWCRVSPAQM